MAFPALPQELKTKIAQLAVGEVIDIRLVIQKRLELSELAEWGYFVIPPNQMQINDFLNEDEIGNMKVRVIFPSLDVATMAFEKWVIDDDDDGGGIEPRMFYVLNGEDWYLFAMESMLHRGMEVQLWTFRIHKELCFALVVLCRHLYSTS